MAAKKDEITFDVLVEIPKGSKNKYEFDKEKGMMRYDRMLHSSMHYPCDYGYVPETHAMDDDPLDAMILLSEPTFPGCLVECRTIGIFKMTDEKGGDNKMICVPVSDPVWNQIHNLSEVNPHLIREIEHFFKVYKDLEDGKTVTVEGWGDRKDSEDELQESIERYDKLFR